MIKIPIEVGDIVLVGRFKNKRVKVKTIEYDENGLPIINGRPLLTMRIQKLMKPKKESHIKLKDLLESIKVSKDTDTMSVDIFDDTNKKIGDFALETYDNKHWTIVGADIDPSSQGKGYYYKSILQLLDKYPDMIIVSAFRSAEADRAWNALKQKIGTKYSITTKVVDDEKVYYLSKK